MYESIGRLHVCGNMLHACEIEVFKIVMMYAYIIGGKFRDHIELLENNSGIYIYNICNSYIYYIYVLLYYWWSLIYLFLLITVLRRLSIEDVRVVMFRICKNY